MLRKEKDEKKKIKKEKEAAKEKRREEKIQLGLEYFNTLKIQYALQKPGENVELTAEELQNLIEIEQARQEFPQLVGFKPASLPDHFPAVISPHQMENTPLCSPEMSSPVTDENYSHINFKL